MNNAMPHLQGRDVLVLGLGASGLAMARWCAQAGARVLVVDTRANPPHAAALAEVAPSASWQQATLDADLFQSRPWAMVCRSPGLAPASMQGLLDAARAVGVPVVGELDLFAQALKHLNETAAAASPAQVVAVTGTNGKTTVTSLTALLLARAGWRVAVAGNIGPNLLDVLQARLDGGDLPQVWVLELSSFQLDGVRGFEPTVGTVLNVTEDHLDWHGSMDAYAEAKSRVFGQLGVMLLNRDDARVMRWEPPTVQVKESGRYRPQPARPYSTFGANLPQRVGDWGLEEVNGMVWLVRALADETGARRGQGSLLDEPLPLQRLMPAEALRIRGRHNACNALAALALATAVGAPLAPMLHGLREYRGEPHRVEPVAIVQDVEYVDDSKGTNVGATLAALTGLGADRRLVVVLGGDGKGQDFTPLAPAVARYARAVVLIGRDAPRLREALAGTGVPLTDTGTLEEAVALCAGFAHAGDAVLLSPACASLDMFRDYKHRADVFVQAVQALQNAEGSPA
jgi:UDP-N-acetylmuramoylalanine--D-glutamate ligase